jgi:hypothetical protein
VSLDVATMFVEMMAALQPFPAEAGARGLIIAELRSMVNSETEALWLVQRMIRLYTKWPGLMELRRVLCQRYVPRDRVEAIGESEVYQGAIPSERTEPEQRQPQLRGAGPVSRSPRIDNAVHDVAIVKSLNRVVPKRPVRQIPAPVTAPARPITDADLRKAEEAYRAAKEKKDVEGETE